MLREVEGVEVVEGSMVWRRVEVLQILSKNILYSKISPKAKPATVVTEIGYRIKSNVECLKNRVQMASIEWNNECAEY